MWRGGRRDWKASPTNSPPSCRGRSTSICPASAPPDMGASVGGGSRKSGRGRRGVPRYGAMADINMTPFIDVMLVLLIIFMVAAPLLTTGVSVDLPRASATALNVDRKPIAVSLNEQGQLYVMDQPTADADLVAK